MIQLADRLVEFVVHSFLPGSADSVLDVIAVVPLVPGQVVKASEQASDPPLGRLPAPEGVVVALLELAPLLGEETFKEILPAYVGLGLSCLSDFLILEVIKGQETSAPAVEVVKKGMLQVGVSSGIHQVSGELGHALGPDIIGSFSLALQHMGCVFRGIAPGTLVIILILPLHKGGAYSTVG